MSTESKNAKVKTETTTDDAPVYAFYGSLRQGMGNSPMLKDTEFVKEGRVKGFKLLSLGAYPYIVKSDNENDTVIVEVLKVPNKTVEENVHWMEIGAGYTREVVDVEGTKAYIYTKPTAGNHPVVEDGDWVNYKKSR